jgi:hypothetical protein
MKQASFLINKDDNTKIKDLTGLEVKEKPQNDTTNNYIKKKITSKKPLKHVENIYYFRS